MQIGAFTHQNYGIIMLSQFVEGNILAQCQIPHKSNAIIFGDLCECIYNIFHLWMIRCNAKSVKKENSLQDVQHKIEKKNK